MRPIEQIENTLIELGLSLSLAALEKLEHYYFCLIEWNKQVNLTAITDIEGVAQKHFADSLLLLKTDYLYEGAKCIDVGTGAGFPGLVLKIARPDISMTLLDSLQKRLRFLELLCDDFGFRDVELLHARAEDAGHNPDYREKYDISLSRAVAPAPVLAEYCLPFVKQGAAVIAYKGPLANEEFARADKALALLGASEKLEFSVFDLPWGERSLAKITKERSTPKRFPRKAGMPSKSPL